MQTMYLEDGTAIIPAHFAIMGRDERIACTPGLTMLHSYNNRPSWCRTTDPRIVTCPLCKQTEEWKSAMKESAPLPRNVA